MELRPDGCFANPGLYGCCLWDALWFLNSTSAIKIVHGEQGFTHFFEAKRRHKFHNPIANKALDGFGVMEFPFQINSGQMGANCALLRLTEVPLPCVVYL